MGAERESVWYVAYGSNLSRARLQRYLARCDPCTAPLDDRPVVLPHRLFFAHESLVWGGGTAFVDPTVDADAGTLARAWLLSRSQFLGVLRQENGGAALSDHDPFAVRPGETLALGTSKYALVLGCPSPDARPALTFTTPAVPLPAPTVPVGDYTATIAAGLAECHGVEAAASRDYLAARGAGWD